MTKRRLESDQQYIVRDEYGLPCSYPQSKDLAVSLAEALTKLGGGYFYSEEVEVEA